MLAGFLSYAHNDNADGSVTEFRKALEREVRAQTGRRDVRIFQDLDDIDCGEEWKERVDSSLDAVTFLVPILTPSFFASDQCRRELERFLDREGRPGQRDLILPVYWIRAAPIDDPARRARDPLALKLHTRQRFDWLELRFKRLTDEDARRALARLAARLRKALDAIAPEGHVDAIAPEGHVDAVSLNGPANLVDPAEPAGRSAVTTRTNETRAPHPEQAERPVASAKHQDVPAAEVATLTRRAAEAEEQLREARKQNDVLAAEVATLTRRAAAAEEQLREARKQLDAALDEIRKIQAKSPPAHGPLRVPWPERAKRGKAPEARLADRRQVLRYRIHRPMLFVGLGGTGCLIGAELERRLRDELCGFDGRALNSRVRLGKKFIPYQLPSCLQFVYADLDEDELVKMRHRVVPSDDHIDAAGRTQHLTHGLIPTGGTYPDVARSLRINAWDYVRDWLPPATDERKVSPLVRGAGQLPTVARAALFEAIRSGMAPARQPIVDAVGEISRSGPELVALGGRLGETCDVFVAFSVAGGTGAGIFYDYLHLVGDVFRMFQQTGFRAQVYPLVLMPSAVLERGGGARRAKLNAGRALLDLFRLIDNQNGRTVGADLTVRGTSGTLGVRYPDQDKIVSLVPSTIQTGVLFHGADGVRRDDLHRSVASLILSLVDGGSFTDEFINDSADRELAASSGIGRRGVSTSMVASMTMPPVDDLADIIASRLIARAVDDLMRRAPVAAGDSDKLIRRFAAAAKIGQIVTREPLEFTEPPPARGADLIKKALRTRTQAMQSSLLALQRDVRRTVPNLVADFDPTAGLIDLLTDIDVVHAQRVVDGDPRAATAVGRGGVVGFLASRRAEPPAPSGFTADPPEPPDIRDGGAEAATHDGRGDDARVTTAGVTTAGVKRGDNSALAGSAARGAPVRGRGRRSRQAGADEATEATWNDPEVRTAIDEQNKWFEWRVQCIWHAAWDEQHRRWDTAMRPLHTRLKGLVDAFGEHTIAEPGEFDRRSRELNQPRPGVTYLLPHGDMDAFYWEILGGLAATYKLPPSAGEDEIVNKVFGSGGWRHVWDSTVKGGLKAGVPAARDQLKDQIQRLLPTMAELLAVAVLDDGAPLDDDIRQFRAKVRDLVPANFSPQGTGNLKVLVSYPAERKDSQIESYLAEEIRLPDEPGTAVKFLPTNAHSITVVLFRTAMGITEVPEVREVLRHWADAAANDHRDDVLRWRQRLGYDDDFRFVITDNDRIGILHHLLCAMWNGQVEMLDGTIDSPGAIRASFGPGERETVTLGLTLPSASVASAAAAASSWGSMLRAYENWVLADEERVRHDFCERLMRTQPEGITAPGRLVDPAVVFQKFIDMAGKQVQILDDMLAELPPNSRGWAGQLYDFWSTTVPAALDMPFENVTSPVRVNLRQLYDMVKARPDSPSVTE
jgi:hypothetical protein